MSVRITLLEHDAQVRNIQRCMRGIRGVRGIPKPVLVTCDTTEYRAAGCCSRFMRTQHLLTHQTTAFNIQAGRYPTLDTSHSLSPQSSLVDLPTH